MHPLQFHAVSDHSFETEESKIKDIMERIFTQYRKEYKGTSLLPKYEYISMMKEEKKKLRCSI